MSNINKFKRREFQKLYYDKNRIILKKKMHEYYEKTKKPITVKFSIFWNKIERKKKDREYYRKNKEYLKQYKLQYNLKNRDVNNIKAKTYRESNKDKVKKWKKTALLKIKLEVFDHYSKSRSCNICGFININALVVDHINGGGKKEKRILNKAGNAFYYWLKKQGYPNGYQILCANCNMIKGTSKPEHFQHKI